MVFNPVKPRGKTLEWFVRSKSHQDKLGEIRWYGPWRQYCFFPESEMVFSSGCLNELAEFMRENKDKRVTINE
jgi:hypothetical protein